MPFALLMHDPLAGSLMLLALLWLSAKVGGELALRLKLPAVTGELAVGLALAALHKAWPRFPEVAASPGMEAFSAFPIGECNLSKSWKMIEFLRSSKLCLS